jgi:hypothetical protein
MSDQSTSTGRSVADILEHLAAVDGMRTVRRPPVLPLRWSTAGIEPIVTDTPDVAGIISELRAQGLIDVAHVSEWQVAAVLARMPATTTVDSLDQDGLRQLVRRSLATLVLIAPPDVLSALPHDLLAGGVDRKPTFDGPGAPPEEWSYTALAVGLVLALIGGTAASVDNQVTDALQNAANLFAVITFLRHSRPRNRPPDGKSEREDETE